MEKYLEYYQWFKNEWTKAKQSETKRTLGEEKRTVSRSQEQGSFCSVCPLKVDTINTFASELMMYQPISGNNSKRED